MSQTVIGFFDNPSDAQKAVDKLQSSGISRDRIDISTGTASTSSTTGYSSDTSTTGNITGNMGTNMGTNVNTDENESGISRFFKSLFGSDDDDDVHRYSRVAEGSKAIVTVHAQSDDEAQDAADILDDNGAIDVDDRAAQYGYASGNYSGTTGDIKGGDINYKQDASNEGQKINKIEEQLNVGKKTVEKGGVRVRSRIIETPVEEHLRLREEHVNVERNPVNRKLTDAELANFQEKDIELVERAEVPVVSKEARVVEEINLTKNVTERDEVIKDTVRKTDVDVQNIDKGQTSTNTNLNKDRDSNKL